MELLKNSKNAVVKQVGKLINIETKHTHTHEHKKKEEKINIPVSLTIFKNHKRQSHYYNKTPYNTEREAMFTRQSNEESQRYFYPGFKSQ